MREHHALGEPGRAATRRAAREVLGRVDVAGGGGPPRAVGQRLEREHARDVALGHRGAQRLGDDHGPRARARRAACAISSGVSSGLIDVTIAPSETTAWKATGQSTLFGASRPTASPAPMPLAPARRATAPTRCRELGVGRDRARRAVDQRGLVAARRRAAEHVLRAARPPGSRRRDTGWGWAWPGRYPAARRSGDRRRRRGDRGEHRLRRRLAALVERAEGLELDAEHDVADRDARYSRRSGGRCARRSR